jgi:hypothetical protein
VATLLTSKSPPIGMPVRGLRRYAPEIRLRLLLYRFRDE